jgi:hypothetical protein
MECEGRRTRTRMRMLWAVGLLAVVLSPGARAWGNAIPPSITFGTSGIISDPGRVSGTPAVSLQGIDPTMLLAPSLYQPGQTINPVPAGFGASSGLGQLVITPAADGSTTTYNNVPFDLILNVTAANGDPSGGLASPELVKGFLNGTVSKSGTNLTLDFLTTSSTSPVVPDALASAFNAGGLTYSLTFPGGSSFSLSGTGGGTVPITGVFLAGPTVPAPEPASIACFSLLCAGLVGYRVRASRRPTA